MAKLEKTFRCGRVEASVWSKTIENKGEIVKCYTVKIQRSYKDEKGQWENTPIFPVEELPKVSIVALEAYKDLRLKQKDNLNKNTVEKGSKV